MAKIGIAIIGAGSIVDYHLAGLAGIAEAEVRVVASRTLAGARAAADRHDIPRASDDTSEVLKDPEIDAVVITTPDDTHEQIAIAALKAGKSVLLQKPMAPSAESCRRILEVAQRTGCDLQVSWMHRYFEEVPAARALIDAGQIGKVTSVRLRNATPGPDWGDWFFRKELVNGGVVHQLGVHGIDLVSHLIGPIGSVSARMATLLAQRQLRDGRIVEVENADTAFAVYEIDGAMVHHEMSMIEVAGTDRFRMEIHGTEGVLWLRTELGPLASRRKGEDRWTVHALPQAVQGRRHHQRWIDGLTGRTTRDTTAHDGLRSMLVAEAIAKSANNNGIIVRVEES